METTFGAVAAGVSAVAADGCLSDGEAGSADALAASGAGSGSVESVSTGGASAGSIKPPIVGKVELGGAVSAGGGTNGGVGCA